MKHNQPVGSQNEEPSPPGTDPHANSVLSPPQLDFARLLGRLLAETWESERSGAALRQSSEDVARKHPR